MSSLLDSNSLDSITKLPEDIGISTFMLHLYNTNKFTDVHFAVTNGQTEDSFSAHKMVLAIWSPYFAEEFYGSSGKMNNLVTLLDINPEAFEVMLKFMYSSKPKIDTLKKACDVHEVAKKFGVRSLMTECYKTLKKVEIKPENVLNVLEASDIMQNGSTRDRCAKVIQEKTKEVTESYQLPNISPSTMNILIDTLNLSRGFKLELFLWIFAWAKNRFVEDHKCSSTRDALKDFLPKLPFLCLSNIEFAELNRSYDQVLEPDEVVSIFMNIAIPESKKMPSWYMKDVDEIIEGLNQDGRQNGSANHETNGTMEEKSPAREEKASPKIIKERVRDSPVQKAKKEKLELTVYKSTVIPKSELSLNEIKAKLKELLSANVDNSDIVNWIDANISSNVVSTPTFIRALVLEVLKVSILGFDDAYKKKYELDQFTLRKRLPFLCKYIKTLPLELQALYAAQQLMNYLNHPKDILRKIFDYFYDEHLITEKAFKLWEHQDSPLEQEGKDDALMSVRGFFTWLKEYESD